MLAKLFGDFRGIARIAGAGTALRWLVCVAVTLPSALKSRNLLAADRLMGTGPFRVRHSTGSALLTGESAFSGLREIWVRDVYAGGGFLQVPDHGTVVDLGANMGNFSAQALAANPTARLIAIEPSAPLGAKWAKTMGINGFENRAKLCRAFIGIFTDKQRRDFENDPAYGDAPTINEDEFLQLYAIEHIDFLKCDIEGSEFFMTEPHSRLLDIADRVAIELHDFGGDPQHFLDVLKQKGFNDLHVDWYGRECIARAARSPAQPLAA
ncbi:MAG TPA: FkbM family methyltransferase [Sphingomonas sp.]|nr:FkbM family methyltransferase [Sphingomonas sp.]